MGRADDVNGRVWGGAGAPPEHCVCIYSGFLKGSVFRVWGVMTSKGTTTIAENTEKQASIALKLSITSVKQHAKTFEIKLGCVSNRNSTADKAQPGRIN